MSFTDAGLDLMTVSYAGQTYYISLHTADPGATGVNEVAGGAYARGAALFDAVEAKAGSGRQVPLTATVPVTCPSGNIVTHVGLWDAVTAGNFIDGRDVTDVDFTVDGTLNVTGYTLEFDN